MSFYGRRVGRGECVSVAPIGGRYRLVERIGAGGMGHVWHAHDDVLRRDVAVKEVRLPAGLSAADLDELRQRTLREARTAARLNHPNVVRVYDVLYADDRPWIVMEYVASRSLATVVRDQGALAPELVARIGLALLYALTAAHQAGVLHRDVKPGNVLLADDGRIMLTDFGLATFDETGLHLTQTGVVYGSPQFIAPERAHDGTSSQAADMWSLGATLYAAVEGRSPYARSSSYATLAALATTTPDPPLHAGVLMPILGGLLIRNPRNRMSADEVRKRLERIIAADAGVSRHIDLPDRHPRETFDATTTRNGTPRNGTTPPAPQQRQPMASETELVTRGSLTRATRAGMVNDGGPLPVADAAASARSMTGTSSGALSTAPTSGAGTSAAAASGAATYTAAGSGPVTYTSATSGVTHTDPASTGARTPDATDHPVSGALVEPTLRTEVAQIVEAVTARITGAPDVASVSTPPATETRSARHAAPAPPETGSVEPDPEPFIMLGSETPPSWSGGPYPNRSRKSDRSWRDNRRPHRWAPATFIAVLAMVLATVAVFRTDVFGTHHAPSTNVGASGATGQPSDQPPGPPPTPRDQFPPPPPPGQGPPPATNLIWFCKPTNPPTTTALPRSKPLPGAKSLPSGWIWYASAMGFRIAVPSSWRLSSGNATDCIYDPYKGRILGINTWTTTAKDPAAALLSRESEMLGLGGLPGYVRVSIADVSDASCKTACGDWVYIYQGPLSVLEVHERAFLTATGAIDTISLTTVVTDYAANQANFTRFAASFVF